jgi:hypothetical protein
VNVPGVLSSLTALLAANKAVAASAAVVVLASGVAAAASSQPPSPVEVEPLAVTAPASTPGPTSEPEADPGAVPASPPVDEEPTELVAVVEPSPTEEPSVEPTAKPSPKPAPEPTKEEPAAPKEGEPDEVVQPSPARLAVVARGTVDELVVTVSNVGGVAAGRTKVRLDLREGASGTPVVLSAPAGADCDGWYCHVDAVPVGEATVRVVFAVEGRTCTSQGGGAKLSAVAGTTDATTWVPLCEDVEPASSDLSVRATGTTAELVVRVDNAGPDVAERVKVKVHGQKGATGTVSVLGTGGPLAGCDGWYCYFDAVPVGQGVAEVRFSVAVDGCSDESGGAWVEVHADTDRVDGNDRVWWSRCDGVDEEPEVGLAVRVVPGGGAHRIEVTNTGEGTVTDVALRTLLREVAGPLVLLESSHPAECTADGCTLAELAAGGTAWVRVSLDVDCDAAPAASLKGIADAAGAQDWAAVELC